MFIHVWFFWLRGAPHSPHIEDSSHVCHLHKSINSDTCHYSFDLYSMYSGGHINGPERLLIRRRKSEGGAFNWPRSAYENFPNFPKIQANFYRCQKAFYIIPKKPPNIMQSKSTQNTPPTPLKKTRKPN